MVDSVVADISVVLSGLDHFKPSHAERK